MNLSLVTEMAELEAAMVDPERAGDRGDNGDMDALVARFGGATVLADPVGI